MLYTWLTKWSVLIKSSHSHLAWRFNMGPKSCTYRGLQDMTPFSWSLLLSLFSRLRVDLILLVTLASRSKDGWSAPSHMASKNSWIIPQKACRLLVCTADRVADTKTEKIKRRTRQLRRATLLDPSSLLLLAWSTQVSLTVNVAPFFLHHITTWIQGF